MIGTLSRTWTTIILSSTTLAFGCSSDFSNEAPSRVVEQELELPSRESTITLPIELALIDIEQRINAEIPQTLYTVDAKKDACIEGRHECIVPRLKLKGFKLKKVGCEVSTKVTPDIDCSYRGFVNRGHISVGGGSGEMKLTIPLHADVTARGRGAIGEKIRETATGSAIVTASLNVDVDKNWQPTVSANTGFQWTDRMGIDVLGFRITFASEVEPEIRQALQKLESELPQMLKEVSSTEQVSQAWKEAFATIQVADDPPVWLSFSPSSVAYPGYTIENGVLKTQISLRGTASTLIGERPEPPIPIELPELKKETSENGFEFYLPILANYAEMETVLENAIGIGIEHSFDVMDLEEILVVFDDITIYQTGKEELAVGVSLQADIPGRWFDANGTIWLVGKISYSEEGNRIYVESLEAMSTTDNELFDLLLALINAPPIMKSLKDSLSYDFNADYESALLKANEALNVQIDDGLYVTGLLEEASIVNISPTPLGYFAGAEFKGKVKIVSGTLSAAEASN